MDTNPLLLVSGTGKINIPYPRSYLPNRNRSHELGLAAPSFTSPPIPNTHTESGACSKESTIYCRRFPPRFPLELAYLLYRVIVGTSKVHGDSMVSFVTK